MKYLPALFTLLCTFTNGLDVLSVSAAPRELDVSGAKMNMVLVTVEFDDNVYVEFEPLPGMSAGGQGDGNMGQIAYSYNWDMNVGFSRRIDQVSLPEWYTYSTLANMFQHVPIDLICGTETHSGVPPSFYSQPNGGQQGPAPPGGVPPPPMGGVPPPPRAALEKRQTPPPPTPGPNPGPGPNPSPGPNGYPGGSGNFSGFPNQNFTYPGGNYGGDMGNGSYVYPVDGGSGGSTGSTGPTGGKTDGGSQQGGGGGGGGGGPFPTYFFASSDEPLANFLGSIFGLSEFISEITLQQNKMTLAFFDNGQMGDQIMPLSHVQNLTDKMATGQCDLVFRPFFFDQQGNSVVSKKVVAADIDYEDEPPCDYTKLLDTISEFKTVLNSLSSLSNYTDIDSISNEITYLTAQEAWVGCTLLIKKALITELSPVTFTDKSCDKKPNEPGYATDPCCNKAISFSQCCAARPHSKLVNKLAGVDSFLLARTCQLGVSEIIDVTNVLNAFVSIESAINDPVTGCLASTAKITGTNNNDWSQLWQTYQKPLETCQEAIYQSTTCSTDADCYTRCILSSPSSTTGKCAVPYSNAGPYLVKCLDAKLDPQIKASLLQIWGIYDVSQVAKFQSEFLKRVMVKRCVGMNSWVGNGGWYKFTDSNRPLPQPISHDEMGMPVYNVSLYMEVYQSQQYNYNFDQQQPQHTVTWCNVWGSDVDRLNGGCFFLPPNEQACLFMKSCNWRYDATEQQCAADLLGNGGYYCGRCDGGGFCWEESQKSLCTLNPVSWPFTGTNQTCAQVNAKAWQDPTQPLDAEWNQLQCITGATNQTNCFDDCISGHGPNPGVRHICVNFNIKSASTCNNLKNNEGWQFASMSYFWDQIAQKSSEYCVAWVGGQDQCAQYAANGFSWETLSKTPEAIENEKIQQCGQSYCYSLNDTEHSCQQLQWNGQEQIGDIQVWYNWNADLNNGQGYCLANLWSSNYQSTWLDFKQKCEGLGNQFHYYIGRNFRKGYGETQSECEQDGICDYNPQLTPDQCNQIQYCDRGCMGCQKDWSQWSNNYDAICYHKNMTQCSIDTAQMNNVQQLSTTNGTFCVYYQDALDSCSSLPGSVVRTCSDYKTKDKCQNGNIFTDVQKCMYGWTQCQDAESCRAAGQCNDWDLRQSGNFWDPNYVPTGVCVLPFTANQDGYAECNDGQSMWGRMGCLNYQKTKIQCQAANGTWAYPAQNEQQCIQAQGCCEPNTDCYNQLTSKNQVECAKCGGKMQSYYQFDEGQWKNASLIKLTWLKRAYASQNSWDDDFNYDAFFNYLGLAIGNRIANLIMTQYQCQYSPILSLIQTFACRCGTNQDPTCGSQSQQPAQLLSFTASCGTSSTSSTAGISLSLNTTSVQNCTTGGGSISLGVSITNPDAGNLTALDQQPQKRNVIHLSRRSATFTTDSNALAACYGTVVNSYGAYVGQLRGDCISFIASSNVASAEVCLPLKDAIPWDQTTYPQVGIAVNTKDANNNDVYTATTLSADTVDSSYCITATTSGVYCPASFKSGYMTIQTAAKPSCSIASTALAAVNAANQVLAGSSTQLSFSTDLAVSTIQSGSYITPALVVTFLDVNGNIATDAAASVTLSIYNPTNKARVIGKVRAVAKAGIATFTQVSVDLVGTYQLQATSGILQPAQSKQFTVIPGTEAKLLFKTQPGGAVQGQALRQPAKIAIVDTYGNTVTTATDTVNVTAYIGSSAVAYTGQHLIQAQNGLVTYTDMTFAQTESSVTLTASNTNLASGSSNSFNVVPAVGYPVALSFTTQPADTTFKNSFTVSVSVIDGSNNVLTNQNSGTVSLAITDGSGNQLATLSGTTSSPVVSGVATFTVSIDKAAKGYQLTASSSSLASATSNTFLVNGPNTVQFSTEPPVSVALKSTFSVTAQVLDINGNGWSKSDAITLSIKPYTGTVGAQLSGTARGTTSTDGSVTFTGLSIATAGNGYILVATSDSGVSGSSSGFQVTSTQSLVQKAKDYLAGLSIGAIAGIVVGVLVLISFCLFLVCRGSKKGGGSKA